MHGTPNPKLNGRAQYSPIKSLVGDNYIGVTSPDANGQVNLAFSTTGLFYTLMADYSRWADFGPTTLVTYEVPKFDYAEFTRVCYRIRGFFESSLQSVTISIEGNSLATITSTAASAWEANFDIFVIGQTESVLSGVLTSDGVAQHFQYSDPAGTGFFLDFAGTIHIAVDCDDPFGSGTLISSDAFNVYCAPPHAK